MKIQTKFMKGQIYTLFLGIILISLVSCKQGPNFTDEPVIEFLRFGSDTISQNGEIELMAHIKLTDGDGDIGSDTMLNVFFVDNRQNVVGETFRIPPIPSQGSKNGVSAEFSFRLEPPCCIYPDGTTCTPRTQPYFDTISYSIYIFDRAGNRSNTVSTSSILLRCD